MLLAASKSMRPRICGRKAASHLLMMRLTQGSPRAAANAASSASPIIQSNISSDGIFSSVVREGAAPELDAIIVLGGGLLAGGGLPLWVQRRLDVAHALYVRDRHTTPPTILCSGGGTPHKPPVLDSNGFVVHEATCCSDYLVQKKNVPPAHVLKEISSYDTVGNAYFSLTIHAIPARWQNVAVITSSFHMPRSRALFEHIWHKAHATGGLLASRSELYFAEASDEGVFEADDVLQIRKEKESVALQRWQEDSLSLPDLQHVHHWLHQTHRCYAVARQHEQAHSQEKRLLASY